MIRVAIAILLAAACILPSAGCRRRADYAYSYHKAQTSQDQLLRDQEQLRKVRGVKRVTTTHAQDGSATIEVQVAEGYDIEIQKKLSSMGYQRGQH